MSTDPLSIIWWNTSLSPPTTKKSDTKKFKISKTDRLFYCSEVIQQFMHMNYDFICLCEVAASDIESLAEQINIDESNYTYISGYEKQGNLIFDTCIFFKKNYDLNSDLLQVRNLIYNSAGRKVKTGQRFEFYLPNIKENLVLYLSHWPSRQSADEILYNSLGQDLRGAINKDLELKRNVILVGDYNVEPHHISMVSGLQSTREKDLAKYRKTLLYNPCWKFLTASQCDECDNKSGTYYLRKTGLFNSWHIIDQILVSKNFFSKKWNFMDNFVEIIDTNVELNDPISDHLAISMFIERT
ncbi:endonuclease/exonuclease/phosphatase family protein [Acinetobacter baumannii]|uniref:endonuclease/exonuclease/phosphatase family protein n=1 Tax=Acinetobacter baumannii TaxID=470 RepID=UPI002448B231|nr:endonuclease/exonuclease/phosphatase family protein [Acinetobacter baumannii]MDH1309878.1 endonuclease/exonuclease/phosphatase family protein [Acinetobacter baumannii]